MINLTIRNIPEDVIKKVKALSVIERRSLNCELLMLIEKGLDREMASRGRLPVSREAQVRLWEELAGTWKDSRSTKNIIAAIYDDRTVGRDVTL